MNKVVYNALKLSEYRPLFHALRVLIIGAGAVVPAGKSIPAGSLVMGVPAKIVRSLEEDEVNGILKNARDYAAAIATYKEHCKEHLQFVF